MPGRRAWRGCGQAVLELALVLPILLLVLLGVVEVGRLAFVALVLQHATYEGVRLAAVASPDAAVAGRVAGMAATVVEGAGVYSTRMTAVDGQPAIHVILSDDGAGPRAEAWIIPDAAHRTAGGAVTVRVRYEVWLLLPLPAVWPANPWPVQVESVGRVEVPPP